MITIYLGDYNKNNCKYKFLKIIYGFIFGYFLFKTIFYYIIIFVPLNYIIYTILLLIFTILGGGLGYAMTTFDKLNVYFSISCSTIPGSFYIIRGIGYIVGGYYSDIITTKLSLKFVSEEGDFKGKNIMYLYLFFQIILIILSIIFQILYIKFKDNYIENSMSYENSKMFQLELLYLLIIV